MTEEFVQLQTRKLWQMPLAWVIGGALFCVSCCGWAVLDVPGFITGRTDLLGNYVDEVEQDEKRENLTPRERLHAELFPSWAIAEANRWETSEQTWVALESALEDPELQTIATELRDLIRDPQMEDRVAELEPLLERWNARHEALDEPFYVTGSVVSLQQGPSVIFEFYAVLAQVDVKIDTETYPTLVLQRIDQTNIQESYFGRTSPRSKRAIVVVDRLVDFAVDHVWLQLADDFSEGPPAGATAADVAFHRAMVDELDAIGPESVKTLRETARLRRTIFETIDQVEARAECGSTLRFAAEVPWDGLRPRTLDRLDAYAEADKIQPCPRVKFEEADLLREASETLRSEAALEPALERLVAWLAHSTVLHEARHLADDRNHDGLEQPLPCDGCPEQMDARVRAELSAYATSLARAHNPATTLYQDCVAVGGSRSHRSALGYLLRQMDAYCDEAPPEDLQEQAAAAEQALFGRSETIALENYPERLPVKWW